MRRMMKLGLSGVLAASLYFPAGVMYVSAAPDPDPEWTEYPLIAHAMGGIDGVDYTNSLEAFKHNYEQGQRVFEVDFSLTEDGQLAARHDWLGYLADKFQQDIPASRLGQPLTLEEFKNYKILRKYTPLSFEDVAQLMRIYSDAYFITDTKETDPELIQKQFTIIRDTANRIDPTILDRLVPELYTPEMIDQVERILPLKHRIFSIYLSDMSPEAVAAYVAEKGIRVVAMPAERAEPAFIQSLKDAGAVAYVHSLNSVQDVEQMLGMGVRGVYTDFLTYSDLAPSPNLPPEAAAAASAQAASAAAVPAGASALNGEPAEPSKVWEEESVVYLQTAIAGSTAPAALTGTAVRSGAPEAPQQNVWTEIRTVLHDIFFLPR